MGLDFGSKFMSTLLTSLCKGTRIQELKGLIGLRPELDHLSLWVRLIVRRYRLPRKHRPEIAHRWRQVAAPSRLWAVNS